ncbi:MAG TPA: protein translocase subunit SecF [Candidatus Pacearchaeota archaeon]|nr:protein translocase subunit SecF [Candidatus Pacearchaeota archaeon]HPR79707.1 protein translocase subunit SecF [Candidatus Pacearchaeota archaeon]
MNFLKYSKLYFTVAIVAIILSIYALFAFGLKVGIDFEGGSLLQLDYKNSRPEMSVIQNALSGIEETKNVQIQPMGNTGIALKISQKDVSQNVYNNIISKIKETGEIDDKSISSETISPLIGKELKNKTIIAATVALIAMLFYIAIAFKNVSKPITSFQYGLSSTLMLFHDIIIPLGVLALLGHFYEAQLTIPVITALLTIVGSCINNTVVVFDRIRENLTKDRKSSYEDIVNKSLNETFARCMNTSLAIMIALCVLYYFLGNEESLKYFTILMGVGVIAGTFSSTFLASPVLVFWNNLKQKKAGK